MISDGFTRHTGKHKRELKFRFYSGNPSGKDHLENSHTKGGQHYNVS
jgi:hypothetical protein